MQTKPAFTLIEILLVIAIIGVLAGVGYLALNPNGRQAQTRNAERQSEISNLQSAIVQYVTEPGQTLASLGSIATCPTTSIIGTSGVNLQTTLVNKYIAAIPTDPQTGSASNTGYRICTSGNGRFTVSAPSAELGESISVNY